MGQISMSVRDVLQSLELGSSVAEYDDELESYFVETETFRALVMGKRDIVAGDKGTGKTALYRILKKRYKTLPELRDSVEIVTGFNPSGSPIFQRLAAGDVLTEGEYLTIWKLYILALVGNWILQSFQGNYTSKIKKLDRLLKKLGLRSNESTPNAVFSKLMDQLRNLSAAQIAVTQSLNGMTTVVPRVEFGENPKTDLTPTTVRLEESLGLLNEVLQEASLSAWVMLDRLDEAFQGYLQTEIPALRALLRAFLDLREFDHIKLKLFVRRDLFRKVTQGGFVNLTHINERKIEIKWEEADLLDLLSRRIKTSLDFVSVLGLECGSAIEVFNSIFPPKVDSGTQKPSTLNWIIKRISDGNGVKPPRNLIDLVKKAQSAQIRREEQSPRNYAPGLTLIEPASLKKALEMLSSDRVVDTLLAEAGDYVAYIEKFRSGKARRDLESITHLIQVPQEEARDIVKVLVEMGFLHQDGERYEIPFLYRDGLDVTQGTAS